MALNRRQKRIFKGLMRELRANGLQARAVKGWDGRGREGTFIPIGRFFHHTASSPGSDAPALGIVTHGRSDLPGPLSNFLVSRSGIVYLVAAGKCNHAGYGGPFKWCPKDAGNTFAIGYECENSGVGEPWSEAQKKAIATLDAIVGKRMRRPGLWRLIGHREYTSRKIDPAGINLAAFRRRVRKRRAAIYG